MKKFLSFIFAFAIIMPCMFLLTACGKDEGTQKVMNVGLNPKLEFVLDKNDKVVAVNALNDDGNHLLSLEVDTQSVIDAFEGMSAEEAVDLFMELSKDNGYLITGNEEEISIEISGDANELIKSVKGVASKFLTDNGIRNITIKTAKINLDNIRAEVKKCMQEYTDAQLAEMNEEQLIALLQTSRQETKEFLTQELKEAYYTLRAQEINIAEFDALFNLIPSAIKSQFDEFITAMGGLETAMLDLQTTITNQWLATDGAYNDAMEQYVEAKENLLKARLELSADGVIDADEKLSLADEEQAVENAKEAVDNALTTVTSQINGVKEDLQEAFDEVKQLIQGVRTSLEKVMSTFGLDMTSLENAIVKAKSSFKEDFNEEFSAFVGEDKSYWENVDLTLTPAE